MEVEINPQYVKPFVTGNKKEHKQYRYEDMMTPYDKLKPLDNARQYLKKGITFKKPDV